MFDSQPTVSDSNFPATNRELKRQFVTFVEERMRGTRSDPEIDKMDMLKGYHSLLAIVHDPTSSLTAPNTTRLKWFMKEAGIKYLENAFDTL